jgi:hypothetical protein
MVGNATPLALWEASGPDVEVFKDLNGVIIDDLSGEIFGHAEGELAFPGPRRSGDRDERGLSRR